MVLGAELIHFLKEKLENTPKSALIRGALQPNIFSKGYS